MDVVIKSGVREYVVESSVIDNNILHAKYRIEKGPNYQKNLSAFYELRERHAVCIIDDINHDVRLISYNSIVDYKEMQLVDITVALA